MSLTNLRTMPLAFPEPLSEKYRPKRVADFIGLDKPKRVMQAFVTRPFPTAWYFVGPSGTGKTTLALAVASEINAQLHLIPSKSCDLETVEHETEMCKYGAFHFFGERKGQACLWHLILAEEADQMTGAAQLAFLSKLDATAFPPNTVFIFTANGTQLLEPRFLSRCKVLPFEGPTDLPKYLAKVYKREGGRRVIDFDKISQECANNVRDGIGRIEVELMMGNDQKHIPAEPPKAQTDEHPHKCLACGVRYNHEDNDCTMKYAIKTCPLGGRPPCAGATTEGAERARRAWQTRREKKHDRARR